MEHDTNTRTKVFVPFTEAPSKQLLDALELSSHDLVPFQLDYQCVAIDLADIPASMPTALAATPSNADTPST